MRRLVDKLMRIVLIKNFLGDGQIDYSNVDSDDEDKKCWMLCLPCRVPPLRCHSMLQLHGYPLTTFIHDEKEEKAMMLLYGFDPLLNTTTKFQTFYVFFVDFLGLHLGCFFWLMVCFGMVFV